MKRITRWFSRKKVAVALVCIGYLFLMGYKLAWLPIFADEAIYIRWAQLIIDDPGQYAFFALNDGKTPLYIWLLTPSQFLFSDRLLAARAVSVLLGLIQLLVGKAIIKRLHGGFFTQLLGMVFLTVLPFWYIHQRMALMDGFLALMISMAVLGVLQSTAALNKNKNCMPWKKLFFSGISLGLALLVKIPAILAFSAVAVLFVVQVWPVQNKLRQTLIGMGTIFGTAGLMFALLALHPAFPQLFSRGSDFLYPVSEVLSGAYLHTIRNIPAYLTYFMQYLSPALCLVLILGLFTKPRQKQVHLFFWMGLLFALPIMVLGKVVYPRYLLPAALFMTFAGTFAFDGLLMSLQKRAGHQKSNLQLVGLAGMLFVGLLLANTLIHGLGFIARHLTDLSQTPYVSADYEQYLSKWSSGHGITETIALLRKETATQRIAVATEGYFGTLPDALLVYLHRTPVDNLYVGGIGQPVKDLPEAFMDRAKNFDRVWLVVNSHRLQMQLGESELLAEYCRPQAAPCLQVWDITGLVQAEP